MDEAHRLLTLQVALGLDHVVGVIKDDAVAALTGRQTSPEVATL
jgi:hypothetical protein